MVGLNFLLSCQQGYGDTLMTYAADKGQVKIVEQLLDSI